MTFAYFSRNPYGYTRYCNSAITANTGTAANYAITFDIPNQGSNTHNYQNGLTRGRGVSRHS